MRHQQTTVSPNSPNTLAPSKIDLKNHHWVIFQVFICPPPALMRVVSQTYCALRYVRELHSWRLIVSLPGISVKKDHSAAEDLQHPTC